MLRGAAWPAPSSCFCVRVAVSFCLLMLGITGCGSQEESVPQASGPFDFAGIAYKTASAVTFAGGRTGSVMVDGYNDQDGNAHVRVRLAPVDGSAMKTFDDDTAVPLQGVLAWLSGTDLIVTGTACPKLSLAAATESEGDDLQAICGATRQVVRHLDLDDGTWTVIEGDLAHDRFPLHPSFGDAPYAFMGTTLAARILTGGKIEAIDNSVFPSDASATSCVGPHGTLAHAVSSRPDNAGLGTFLLKGKTWEKSGSQDADSTADAEGAGTSYYCTAEGFVVAHLRPNAPQTTPSYEILAIGPDGTTTSTAIDPPPIDPTPGGPPLTVDGAGQLLAFDADVGTTFALQGGTWHRLDGRLPPAGTVTRIVVGHQVNWVAFPRGGTFGGKVSASD